MVESAEDLRPSETDRTPSDRAGVARGARPLHISPWFSLASIAAAIFVAELTVMASLEVMHPGSRVWAALIDASVLVAVIAPAVHFLLVRPLLLEITERRRAEARVAYTDSHDRLTGLANGAYFNDRVGHAVAAGRRDGCLAAVLFVDLDRLTLINESLGREAGDCVLRALGERLAGSVRGGDEVFRLGERGGITVARLGGDEFVLLLPRVTTVEDVAAVARRLLGELAQPVVVAERPLVVTSSIGISIFPDDGETAEALLENAATAMRRIKRTGGNSLQFYSPAFNAKALERLTLETALRHALESEQLQLHFQPQIDLGTETVVGMEALVRWQHPRLGMISPAQFIPVAEETGLIVALGEWVLRAACRQHAAWCAGGLRPVRVAVNFSARQFEDRDVVGMVGRAIRESGLSPGMVEVELTESVLQDADRAAELLRDLADSGVTLSIDDFGTGYSSLSYLRRFPIHRLKIDQSFVRGIPADASDMAVVSAIITLAHAMGLRVVAEGVERREQADFLRSRGCDAAQGYFFGKPLPAEEASRFLAARTPGQDRLAA